MDRLLLFFTPLWFAGVLIIIALLLGATLLLVRWRRRRWSSALMIWGAGCALVGIGGLVLPPDIGAWTAAIALLLLFFMVLWLIITSQWSAPAAYLIVIAALVGIGGWCTVAAGESLLELGRTLVKVEVVHPWWLLCLGFVPLIVMLSFRSLSGLGTFRRWTAIGLRCSLIVFLTLAIAEVRLRQSNESVTVLFLVDRSLSVPPEFDPDADPNSKEGRIDHRWERVKQFITDAVEKRGDAHKRDKFGLIFFGRRPRLELPPSDAPTFTKDKDRFFDSLGGTIDSNYTDIASAIKLALASFPEGTGKRIVMLSDGNENLGNAEEQARLARQNGVQIDIVPLAAGYRNEHEVLVQSVEAPPITEQGARFPIRVLIRSYNPRLVKGTVTLRQIVGADSKLMPPAIGKPGGPLSVTLRPGLNSITFPPPDKPPTGSYTYEAIFQSEGVLVDGNLLPAPRGHPQNKRATTHVLALGQRKVLLIENKEGEHDFLFEHLRKLGESKFKVQRITAAGLPQDKADLGFFLSNYDCVILANTPCEALSDEQQEMLRSNTFDQGCGFIMVGGPESFGAGGWQSTPVEKALPVDCDIKAMKVQGKGGLVLIFHATEMGDGNKWQKEIGKLAINKLSAVDMMGILMWDYGKGAGGGTSWHIPFQTIGGKKASMLRLLDKMDPGDMPDCNPSLKMAMEQLTKAEYLLAKKHIIFISDGDHWTADPQLLNRLRGAGITCTTICITTHGQTEVQKMNAIATATRGKFYNVTSGKQLPEIYTKEVRLVSQSFVFDKEFTPKLMFAEGPADKLPAELPNLHAFVRTTAKPAASVQKPILGPPQGEQDFPILAYWQYGLGKSVAWTSDARSGGGVRAWDQKWADSELYQKFWEQMVDYALRAVETGKMTMTTEYRDGKVRVTIDARDDKNRPLTDLKLKGGITIPGAKPNDPRKMDLRFEQKNSGLYEAEFKADDSGSYFINVASTKREGDKDKVLDSVRGGVTIPYSPEFSDLESNVALMDRLRSVTDGATYADNKEALTKAAAKAEVFRPGLPSSKSMQPIWFWLVFLTAVLLFFDVGVRRIAIEPEAIGAASHRLWERLRGRAVPVVQTGDFLDKLRTRKEVVGESLDKGKAAARFDAGDRPPSDAPPGAEGPSGMPATPPRRPSPQPGVAPQKEEEPQDFASRLMRAKKKVWEERDKGKE
ncbi:MAG: VWA domain-containing protein [Gemmataceae bacterium]|nr:VWA domain-containing protein [Gemmataceae bacterium]